MSGGTRAVDVLIVGAGPIGLLTAYQLGRFGNCSVAIIERQERAAQDTLGRALTLYPRSCEMMDQLGLAEALLQQCFACRDTVTYNAQGDKVDGRGWTFMSQMKDTAYDFALLLRQKYQEEIFRKAMARFAIEVETPVELMGIDVDEAAPPLSHRITATVRHCLTETTSQISCKYLVGCDGGRSSVRRMMGIPFDGSTTEDRWVRIDGHVKTNLPTPRSYCAIESPTHGNVLFAGLDHGATRIGYAFPGDRSQRYEVFDEAAAVEEAVAAVRPFELKFDRVDWWTIYSVGQRIARTFFHKGCVFLAGDACHTHSSGVGQGMNTGVHDAVNLAWKLSIVLTGSAKLELLQTYQAERLPNVQRLIQFDKGFSCLMTNRLPENWDGDPDAHVSVVLGEKMADAATFSSGLGISYEMAEDNILSVPGSFKCPDGALSIGPGQRAPDVPLVQPGIFQTTRLLTVTPNLATFYVLVFGGDPAKSNEAKFFHAVKACEHLQELERRGGVTFVTILPKRAASPYDLLGHSPLGRIYFDTADREAYRRYFIDEGEGAIVVVRPDGWIATMCRLCAQATEELQAYFQRILL